MWNKGHGVYIFQHEWDGFMRASERGKGKRIHPTQKPVALMEWVVEKCTKAGDTVFDPYMGSGSTALACINTGRNFVGCEIVQEYFDGAQDRVRQAQSRDPRVMRDAGESLPSIARKLKLSVPEVARMLRGAV